MHFLFIPGPTINLCICEFCRLFYCQLSFFIWLWPVPINLIWLKDWYEVCRMWSKRCSFFRSTWFYIMWRICVNPSMCMHLTSCPDSWFFLLMVLHICFSNLTYNFLLSGIPSSSFFYFWTVMMYRDQPYVKHPKIYNDTKT